jgi:flavin-dependent dehydrogenase
MGVSAIKVAIMGSGLSGLSCAITLEKNGIYPTIFEKRSEVGDRFVNAEALLDILNRPVKDCIAFFAEAHGIYLKPSSNIKKMTIYSENEKAVIEGHLGFLNIRGRESDSFEKQLEKQVKSPIHFHSEHSYEALLHDYTHVILATGDAAYTKKIQDFQEDLTVTLKGATVEGKFDRFSVFIWLNNDLAPKGYAYLLPFSDTEANIVIALPEYPENNEKDIEILWDKLYIEFLANWSKVLKLRINSKLKII